MRRQQLIELTRRVAQISGTEAPIICGTQSVFAYTTLIPDIVSHSVECDYLFTNLDRDTRNQIIDDLGIDSDFREREGYYADPLGLFTVVLPPGWQERLQPLWDEEDRLIAYCTELYDTAFRKLIAGREKDFEFLGEIMKRGLLDPQTLAERIASAQELMQASVIPSRLETLQERMRTIRSGIDLGPLHQLLRTLKKSSSGPGEAG